MPDFLVGAAQTYTTIQGAVDAIAAIGDLTGLGDHNIVIDNGFVHNGNAPNLASLQAAADGRVIIKAAPGGTYTLALDTTLTFSGYTTLQDFSAYANTGFTGANLIADGNTEGNIVQLGSMTNPNSQNIYAVYGDASWRDNRVFDCWIVDFNVSAWHAAAHGMMEVARVTAYNCGYGIVNCATVTDCAATDSTTNDFNNNTTVTYCASSDTTASGAGSITSIVATTEFVDPVNDDFTLAGGSQLILAGSTGLNDIGWYQSPPPSRAIVNIDTDNDVYPGQTNVVITTIGLDATPATQTATIGGETVTVNTWSETAVNVNIPLHINLEWDTTYQLALTDDTGTVTKSNITLSTNPNWETVTFNGTAPDPGTTESFYEHAQTDSDVGNFTMVATDILAWESAAGLSIDDQTIPVVDPPSTVSGAYKIWDTSLSTWTGVSAYTITDGGVLSGVRPSHGPTTLRGLLPQRLTSYTGKQETTPGAFSAAWVEANIIMGTFKRNTAVTGFTVVLLSATDGSVITSGTPAVYVTKDGGTQAAIAGSATHEGNGQWSFNLTANEMDADVVGLLVTVTGGIAVNHTLRTDTSLISEVHEDTGTTGVVISNATALQIADALLNRDMSAVADTNARTPLNALRFMRNRYSVAGTTLTVTKEDDTTTAWTSTLTVDANADPVTGSDPA